MSTGAHVAAAIKVAEEMGEGTIVTIVADSFFRYTLT